MAALIYLYSRWVLLILVTLYIRARISVADRNLPTPAPRTLRLLPKLGSALISARGLQAPSVWQALPKDWLPGGKTPTAMNRRH